MSINTINTLTNTFTNTNTSTLTSRRYSWRYSFLILLLLGILGGLTWRVCSLHIVEQDFLRHQGEARTIRTIVTSPYRGMITDRNNEPLAISTPVDSVWVNPKEFSLEHPELLTLANLMDLSLDQLIEKIKKNASREFVYLQRHVNPETAEKLKTLEIPGVYLKAEYRRYYPAAEITAHVLGFTNVDDHGLEGLESAFDKHLSGSAGCKRVVQDRRGREVEIIEGLQAVRSGQNVTLSLDQRLQYLAYKELKATVQAHNAKAGSAVVVDVTTGEVLAMVNQPSFNPNTRLKIDTVSRGCFRNRAVTDVLEPGSVMKTFSVVSALQNGHVTPSTLVDTSPGFMTVGGRTVKEDKNRNYGLIDVATILKKSSNVGVSKLTLDMPSENLWETYRNMGFGLTTGSGFPGESSGILMKPPRNGSFMLATMSFGYGVSVTPLQLAQAYAVLGAGGIKRPMTFLKQTTPPEGERVLDAVVARQVVDMLNTVVTQGGGSKAQVLGYQTAGKTGTARKVSATGGYQMDSHVAVFAGVAPASDPKFAIVVVIDDPQGSVYYGSQLAAPLFSKIAACALRLFNIPPDMVDRDNLRVAKREEDNRDASFNE